MDAICRSNVFLRTTERVLLKVGSFHAETWEELFQGTKALPWEEYIPKDGSFWVTKASSIKSKLFSSRDIQSIMKKAMVTRLGEYYGIQQFEEHGAKYPIRVFALKDEFTVCLDTSGESLHKRGYRLKQGLRQSRRHWPQHSSWYRAGGMIMHWSIRCAAPEPLPSRQP